MCDGFLVLAHVQNDDTDSKSTAAGVPSCFFVPRWLPNGERNPFYLQRLKDKLGNRSNASSEVEFNNTQGVSRDFILIKLNRINFI
jgi:putative acyl-CoA dehydrogenase